MKHTLAGTSTLPSVTAVYTGMSILMKMKKELGKDAMLAYMDKYLSFTEENNLFLQSAVLRALSSVDVQKMHREAMYEKQV